MNSEKTIFISTGEISGDLQGSLLVEQLNKLSSNKLNIIGLGGEKLKRAGCKILHDITLYSSVGFIEPISFLIRKLKVAFAIKKLFKKIKIDLVILVDNQGFNIPLAKWAKKFGLKVIYYFPPPVSIWGKWNIEKLKERCDIVISTFVKDHDVLIENGVNSFYFGHPFFDYVKASSHKEVIRSNLKLDKKKLVLLLPGSRFQEIRKFLEIMLDASKLIHSECKTKFIILAANQAFLPQINKLVSHYSDIDISIKSEGHYDYINAADLVITSSGSATLEVGILSTPMIIVYKVSLLTYIIGKLLVKSQFIGLPNILLDASVVVELIQNDMTAENIFRSAMIILSDEEYAKSISENLSKIRCKLGSENVLVQIANLVLSTNC